MIDPALLEPIAQAARSAVIAEWRAQGHELTGRAAQEVETVITQKTGAVNIDGYILDYMGTISTGVPAERIPYTRGSGARTSQYIAGLTRYASLRMGASQQEAERIAFAIASVHKREGLPSERSKRFSSTGRRTGFIATALDKEEPVLAALIEDAIEVVISGTIENFFRSQIAGR